MGGKCELTSDLHCCPQGESGEELSPVPSDWLPDLSAGQRTSVCSTGSEDTMPSPISRQLSGSKCEKNHYFRLCERNRRSDYTDVTDCVWPKDTLNTFLG